MGIDVYLKWTGQSAQEGSAQITGFAINKGEAGYLREGYGIKTDHFATKVLFQEAFYNQESPSEGIRFVDIDGEQVLHIPAQVMKNRLEGAAITAMNRYSGRPDLSEMAVSSLERFVALAEDLEARGETTGVFVSW